MMQNYYNEPIHVQPPGARRARAVGRVITLAALALMAGVICAFSTVSAGRVAGETAGAAFYAPRVAVVTVSPAPDMLATSIAAGAIIAQATAQAGMTQVAAQITADAVSAQATAAQWPTSVAATQFSVMLTAQADQRAAAAEQARIEAETRAEIARLQAESSTNTERERARADADARAAAAEAQAVVDAANGQQLAAVVRDLVYLAGAVCLGVLGLLGVMVVVTGREAIATGARLVAGAMLIRQQRQQQELAALNAPAVVPAIEEPRDEVEEENEEEQDEEGDAVVRNVPIIQHGREAGHVSIDETKANRRATALRFVRACIEHHHAAGRAGSRQSQIPSSRHFTKPPYSNSGEWVAACKTLPDGWLDARIVTANNVPEHERGTLLAFSPSTGKRRTLGELLAHLNTVEVAPVYAVEELQA